MIPRRESASGFLNHLGEVAAARASLALLLLGVAAPVFLSGCGRPACPRCNVVLISIDTLRADRLGTYGYERNTSPSIDAFAEQSVVFTNVLAQFPRTVESHWSLFTSRYPFRFSGGQMLAEVLRDAGYRTAGWPRSSCECRSSSGCPGSPRAAWTSPWSSSTWCRPCWGCRRSARRTT